MYVISCRMFKNITLKEEKEFYIMVNQLEGGLRWGSLDGIGEVLVFPTIKEAMSAWETYKMTLVTSCPFINKSSITLKKLNMSEYKNLTL